MAVTPPRTLAAIEREIADEHDAYLHATWEGRAAEADAHREAVDELLQEWGTLHRGGNT